MRGGALPELVRRQLRGLVERQDQRRAALARWQPHARLTRRTYSFSRSLTAETMNEPFLTSCRFFQGQQARLSVESFEERLGEKSRRRKHQRRKTHSVLNWTADSPKPEPEEMSVSESVHGDMQRS
eukprot:6187173-Pleurochrysis_carterae.AAC.5